MKNWRYFFYTLLLRAWAFFKVPMLFWIRPRIERYSEEEIEISIPLMRRTRNHLHSMYFGVLACGADIAAGLIAMIKIYQSRQNISLVFKDVQGQFKRRPLGRTYFVCKMGREAKALIERAVATGEREEAPFYVTATSEGHVVAEFTLTLSVKKRSPKD